MSTSPPSRRATLVLILGAALPASCESFPDHDARGCAGPRRPANPHGSVLAPEAKANTETLAAGVGQCRGGRP